MFAWINRHRPALPHPLCGVGAVRCRLRARRARLAPHGHEPVAGAGLPVLVVLGLRDVTQDRHAVLRNYPVIGHLRFLLEFIRPEIRQYFIEGDNEAAPFSRQQRSLVYQRAKGDSDKRPFGTQMDVGAVGYEWINHSMQPTRAADARLPRPRSAPAARSRTAPASSTSRR